MIHLWPHRTKGPRALGASQPGDTGPFGQRPDPDDAAGSMPGALLTAPVGALGHDSGHRTMDLMTKGGVLRRVPLVPLAVEALEIYLATRPDAAEDEPLFATATGRPMDEPAVLRLIRRVAKKAGIPQAGQLSPHSLRHAYATAAHDAGVPLADIQDAMGHADPRTTRRYDRSRGSLHRSPSYRLAEDLAEAMHTAPAVHPTP